MGLTTLVLEITLKNIIQDAIRLISLAEKTFMQLYESTAPQIYDVIFTSIPNIHTRMTVQHA